MGMPGEYQDDTPSCLAAKLERLVKLDEADRKCLSKFETAREKRPAGTCLIEFGQQGSDLFILRHGMAITYSNVDPDEPSIVQVHFPGDLIGMSGLPFSASPTRTSLRTDAVLCALPRDELGALFHESPRLSGLLFALAAIEESIFQDRVRIVAHGNARMRLALYALQTMARLRLLNGVLDHRFHSPLTQAELGNILGLTNIHVSRTLTAMEEEGLLARDRSFFRLLDPKALRSLSGFVDRYSELDLSWLPRAA